LSESKERQDLVVLNLSGVATAEELQVLLRDALGFPGWYGRNWNAFWDAITALAEMPRRLQLIDWEGLTERLPKDACIMKQCFDEMSVKYPSLAAIVEYR
jgi:RNAse (barnase) inhibitor barstar